MDGPWGEIDVSKIRSIGSVATVELAVRGIGGATLADLVDQVADGILVAFAVALTSGWIGQTLGTLATWILYALVLYTSLPKLFPATLSELSDDRGFVGLIAVGSIIIAFPLQSLYSQMFRHKGSIIGDPVGPGLLPVEAAVLVVLLWSAFFCLYLRFVRSEPTMGDDGVCRRLIVARDDNGQVTDILTKAPADRTLLDRIVLRNIIIAIGLMFGIVVLGMGVLIAVLWLFYPIPELLFVTATISSAVHTRGDRFEFSVSPEADLEQDIGAAMFSVLESDKGVGIAIMTMMGLAVSIALYLLALYVGSQTIPGFITSLDAAFISWTPSSMRLLAGSAAGVGAAVILVVAATLLLWVWVRLAKRSVAFTATWDADQGDDDMMSSTPTVSRPPGGAAVPVVLAITAIPITIVADVTQPWVVAYGVFWPVGLLGAGLWVRYTIRQPPQPARSDNTAYPISFGLIVLPALVLTVLQSQFQISAALMAAGVMILLPYLDPDLKKALERAGSPWGHLAEWTSGMSAVPLLVFAVIMPQYTTLCVLGALAVVGWTALAVLVDK